MAKSSAIAALSLLVASSAAIPVSPPVQASATISEFSAPVDTASIVLFSDMRGHWASEYIDWAINERLVTGYDDGTFRPDRAINEAEYLALLLRAYGLAGQAQTGELWYKPYYSYARQHGWPLVFDINSGVFRRGEAARLLATAATGKALSETGAIQWLLDEEITNGRTAPTVQGFYAEGQLTRAEALTFIYRIKEHTSVLSANKLSSESNDSSLLNGIAIGDSADKLSFLLGKASRSDAADGDFTWQVYNANYDSFAMYGIRNNKVVGLFTNAVKQWQASENVYMGVTLSEARKALSGINGTETNDYYTYDKDGIATTLFIDRNNSDRIIGILQMRPSSLSQTSVANQTALQSSYEKQIMDLTNAERKRRGIDLLSWDTKAAAAARAHSKDMVDRSYFSHTDPDGRSPFDRLEDEGISYHYAAENIAAGHTNSIYAHFAWMNSASHRSNILHAKMTKLGTGVVFGGTYRIYYTQNFYKP
ncbi:CAP domain-containing protein [Paenibacillus sp. NEAU-GSW1]|uniref:CAP domain-containing protein n=1 Tax=Paenibacillus sp. NEAU-GSW1 TaxID=2682486 RepID=UPI0015674AF5|nr:CAP domain-containing protein [Paenibacillus sp. NEAU-GSW1]